MRIGCGSVAWLGYLRQKKDWIHYAVAKQTFVCLLCIAVGRVGNTAEVSHTKAEVCAHKTSIEA